MNTNLSLNELSNEIRSKYMNIWRCADSGWWKEMKNSGLLTFAWLKKNTNYSKHLNNITGNGKRSISHWVNSLSEGDLIFVMDKKNFYGICVAKSKYSFSGPFIDIPEWSRYPAIEVEYLLKLDSPINHGFTIHSQQPATFAKIDDYGFDLKNILQFLKTKNPKSIEKIFSYSVAHSANKAQKIKSKRRIRKAAPFINIEEQFRKGSDGGVTNPKHNKIQQLFVQHLKTKFGADNVRSEENHVDIKLFQPDYITFYEVKPYDSVEYCIRIGLGQVLSYICFDDTSKRKKKKIKVVGPYPPNSQDKKFIKFLKDTLKINFEYEYFNVP